MSTRKHTFIAGEFYHLYNRGNSKQTIFFDNDDYEIFQKLLYLMNMGPRIKLRDSGANAYEYERGEQLVAIGSYCLMPNHFHILCTPKIEGGPSLFMQKVLTSYSGHINKKYNRSGSLFEGRFKSKYVYDDLYLKYLFSYIHLNPLKLKNKNWKEDAKNNDFPYFDFAIHYPYSSINFYRGKENIKNKIITIDNFPPFFHNKEEAIAEMKTWIHHQDLLE